MAFFYCMCENRSCLTFHMVKIYTKTGDDGKTALYDGVRVLKTSKIIRVLGEIDEVNSLIGFLWNACKDKWVCDVLSGAQVKLYEIGAEIAGSKKFKIESVDVGSLEKIIDEICDGKEFKAFVRPGERGEFSARAHVARTACRRAERSVFKFAEKENGSRYKHISQYLNRLSDLLFAIAELK